MKQVAGCYRAWPRNSCCVYTLVFVWIKHTILSELWVLIGRLERAMLVVSTLYAKLTGCCHFIFIIEVWVWCRSFLPTLDKKANDCSSQNNSRIFSTGEDKGVTQMCGQRCAGVELFFFFFRRGRIKTETVWFKNRLPALRRGHIHMMILCCLTNNNYLLSTVGSDWRVRVEARSGFRTRLAQRGAVWGGGGGRRGGEHPCWYPESLTCSG